MQRWEDKREEDESIETGEDGMKVPIDDTNADVPADAELDEDAMVEAAIRAGEQAADEELAAEAAILHDCTKKAKRPEQLALCERYGVVPDELERESEKLMHAKTGAAVAEREFGCAREVVDAIRWHTTGKAGMTLLEQIIYMADYIEPTRDFEGVEPLRALAYEDLDRAMLLGLDMSLEEIAEQGNPVHPNTLAARAWFEQIVKEKEERK